MTYFLTYFLSENLLNYYLPHLAVIFNFNYNKGFAKATTQTSFLKITANVTVKQDERGRHNKYSRVEKIRESRVMSHIKTFKVIESHYVQKYATCQYLPEELNIKSDSHLPKKIIFICFNESPLKMMKNAF